MIPGKQHATALEAENRHLKSMLRKFQTQEPEAWKRQFPGVSMLRNRYNTNMSAHLPTMQEKGQF